MRLAGPAGDGDGDGIPNYAEQYLNLDPTVAQEREVLGPGDVNLYYKIIQSYRTKYPSEPQYGAPDPPDPVTYYTDLYYTLEHATHSGCVTPTLVSNWTHHVQYDRTRGERYVNGTNYASRVCGGSYAGLESVIMTQFTNCYMYGGGLTATDTVYCDDATAHEESPGVFFDPLNVTAGQDWVEQSTPAPVISPEGDAFTRRVANGGQIYEEIVVLDNPYTDERVQDDAEADLDLGDGRLDEMWWSSKVVTYNGSVNDPEAKLPSEPWRAKKDISNQNAELVLQRLHYLAYIHSQTEVGKVYEINVARLSEREDTPGVVEVVGSDRLFAIGDGVEYGMYVYGPDEMTIEPPEYEGEVWPSVCRMAFVDGTGGATDELHISKWPGAFSGSGGSPAVAPSFVTTDADRFQIHVVGLAGLGPTATALLSTDHQDSTLWDDNETAITLTETVAGSGAYISETMILVSNTIDDRETHQIVDGCVSRAPDNSTDDRTHIARLGSLLSARLSSTVGRRISATSQVPLSRRVVVNVKILKDGTGNDAVQESRVKTMFYAARELYSQVGIELVLGDDDVTITANPPGVDLSDGIAIMDPDEDLGLTPEAQAIVDNLGTADSTIDLHVFYVNPPFRSTAKNDPQQSSGTGLALNESLIHLVNSDYLFNAFIIDEPQMTAPNGLPLGSVFTLAHEIGHLLGITGHANDQWRLMYGPTDRDSTDVNDTKRLTNTEQGLFYGRDHVETLP